MSIPYADLPLLVKEWITAHPYQTALHVVNGVVFFTPAAATVPILASLGFTSAGPAAGTVPIPNPLLASTVRCAHLRIGD
jgi:hypothetical protein